MAVSGPDLFLGCPQMNFKANPPFNEMRQGFATFKKETRMAQYFPGLFENLRLKVIIRIADRIDSLMDLFRLYI